MACLACLSQGYSEHPGWQVSSQGKLEFTGDTDLAALHGDSRNGQLLLDPYDIWIAGLPINDGALPSVAASDGASDDIYVFTAQAILTALASGDVSIAATHDIEIATPLSADTYHSNKLTFTAGNTIVVFNGCDLSIRGKLVMNAAEGIDMRTNVHSDNTAEYNADSNNDGTGTLTIADGKGLSTRNALLSIQAADINILGEISSGLGQTTFVPTNAHNVGLGSGTVKDTHITDTELGNVVSAGGFTIGDATTGSISVTGITMSNSDTVGTLTLVATKSAAGVTFESTISSFQKGLVIQTDAGISVDTTVTTNGSPCTFNCGTGTLSITALKSLSTTDQLLLITANDIKVDGTLEAGVMNVACTTAGRTLGLGHGTKLAGLSGGGPQFVMDTDELQKTTNKGMSIGGPNCANQDIIGITNSHSEFMVGIISLVASRDDATITFSDTSSTFHGLAAQSDSGIVSMVHLTTTESILYLDGDIENSSSQDVSAVVKFGMAKAFRARTILTLEATTGQIDAGGQLWLYAGCGIVIHERLTGEVPGQKFVLNADYDSFGDGTLTLSSGKVITSNNADVEITAWDIDMGGSITTG